MSDYRLDFGAPLTESFAAAYGDITSEPLNDAATVVHEFIGKHDFEGVVAESGDDIKVPYLDLNCIEESMAFMHLMTLRPNTQLGLLLGNYHASAAARDTKTNGLVFRDWDALHDGSNDFYRNRWPILNVLTRTWQKTPQDVGIYAVQVFGKGKLTFDYTYHPDYTHRFTTKIKPSDSRVLIVGKDALTAGQMIIERELAPDAEKPVWAARCASIWPHVELAQVAKTDPNTPVQTARPLL